MRPPGSKITLSPGSPDTECPCGHQRPVCSAHRANARAGGHAEILPAHLVLGLLAEPAGLAAKALLAQGAGPDEVRATAAAVLPGPVPDAPELVPFDAAAKKVLELTFREALRLGHNYVGTEHLLLALLEHENGAGVLSGLGVTRAASEQHIAAALAELG